MEDSITDALEEVKGQINATGWWVKNKTNKPKSTEDEIDASLSANDCDGALITPIVQGYKGTTAKPEETNQRVRK